MKVKCRAKINLGLDVLGKREDNYHLVRMIMQSIDLYDYIIIDETKKDIVIECDSDLVPCDDSNIIYKAVNLLKMRFNIDKGVKIKIIKNIPVAAGLAGGSSNAAGTLVALNKLWNLKLSVEELKELGLALGADVPFCIQGGCALAEGIGEKLSSIEGLKDCYILICKPDIQVSTAMVYNQLNMQHVSKRPNIDKIIEALKMNELPKVCINMENVLSSVTEKQYPIISLIKDEIDSLGANRSLMSGSGPTVFGIFDNFEKGEIARKTLKLVYEETYLVNNSERGIEIEG